MVREIMETAFLSQAEMAEKLHVSQQTISNWLSGFRNPRAKMIPGLLELAEGEGLDISKYEADQDIDRINVYMEKNKDVELARIFELYARMDVSQRKRFMREAERLVCGDINPLCSANVKARNIRKFKHNNTKGLFVKND